jgi:hypothetical protein
MKHAGSRMAAVVVWSVATFAGSLAMAGSATAAPSCPSGALCIWENANYSGAATYQIIGADFASGECVRLTADWDNRISSVINKSQRSLTFFDDGSCQGSGFTLPPMAQIAELGSLNDRISSIRV